jgi:ATP-binding cassette subfamily F protein 3
MNEFSYGEDEARSVLGGFLFRGDDVFKIIDSLSGGEQARLALLKLFLHGPNFLILDEPTNHLDIPTREILEQALLDFGGTYLVVSHDRYFLDKIAGRTLVLENKKLKEFLGNYSYYREKEQEKAELAAQAALENGKALAPKGKSEIAVAPKAEVPSVVEKAGLPAPVQKQSSYATNQKLDKVEMKIAELEATIKMYEFQMNQPENQTDSDKMMELTKLYGETQKQLDAAYEKWEALSE